jgi:hypothetical protein
VLTGTREHVCDTWYGVSGLSEIPPLNSRLDHTRPSVPLCVLYTRCCVAAHLPAKRRVGTPAFSGVCLVGLADQVQEAVGERAPPAQIVVTANERW